MQLMEWLRQVREWFGGRMDDTERTSSEPGGMEARRRSPLSDGQLTLPGMTLQREWTYGRLGRN